MLSGQRQHDVCEQLQALNCRRRAATVAATYSIVSCWVGWVCELVACEIPTATVTWWKDACGNLDPRASSKNANASGRNAAECSAAAAGMSSRCAAAGARCNPLFPAAAELPPRSAHSSSRASDLGCVRWPEVQTARQSLTNASRRLYRCFVRYSVCKPHRPGCESVPATARRNRNSMVHNAAWTEHCRQHANVLTCCTRHGTCGSKS